MQQLGVEARQCLFVGDGGSRELEGARNLGITTVMITGIIREIWPERIKARQAQADYVIEWLNELIRDGERESAHGGHGKKSPTWGC
jgi:putative hydrolase of the HAD superfamily